MIAAGQNPDFICCDLIDEPMLLVYSARPAARQVALQRFGFPYALEGITLHIFDQADNPQRFLSILLDPPGQIFKGGRIKFQVSQRLLPVRFRPDAL